MKAYLITMIALRAIGLLTAKNEKVSDEQWALAWLISAGLLGWTIYLLCQL